MEGERERRKKRVETSDRLPKGKRFLSFFFLKRRLQHEAASRFHQRFSFSKAGTTTCLRMPVFFCFLSLLLLGEVSQKKEEGRKKKKKRIRKVSTAERCGPV